MSVMWICLQNDCWGLLSLFGLKVIGVFLSEIPESWRRCRRREVAVAGQTGEFGVDCSTVWDKNEKCPRSELVFSCLSTNDDGVSDVDDTVKSPSWFQQC